MGWFGISNTANRHINVQSMTDDITAVNNFKGVIGNLRSAVDFQLGRANTLADIIGSQPNTHQYSRNNVSVSAAQLACELRVAIQGGQQFRDAVSNLNAEVNEGAELIGNMRDQYDLPRGNRTIRFTAQNVPPSGQELATWSENIALACIYKVSNVMQQNEPLVLRTFNTIERADQLVTGRVSDNTQRPNALLRQFLAS